MKHFLHRSFTGIANITFACILLSALFANNSSAQIISTFPGSTSLAAVNQPYGMTVDAAGNVYVVNYAGVSVSKITPAGVFTAGFFVPPGGNGPVGICVDPTFPTSGNMYVSDFDNNTIYKVNAAGVGTAWTLTGTALNGPESLARDASGNIYVWNWSTEQVLKITTAGGVSAFAGDGTNGNTGDNGPATSAKFAGGGEGEVAVDALNNVYIVDQGNSRVRMVAGVTGGGKTAGDIYAFPGLKTFSIPGGVKADALGNVYISERGTSKVWKVNSAGTVSLYAGNGTAGYTGEGLATSVELNSPYGLALDASNNLYISDVNNNRVREVICTLPTTPSAPSGITSRCFGSGTSVFTTSSTGATSYNWSVSGAGNTISGTTNSATVTWSSTYTGLATVSVTATNGCGNSPAATSTVAVGGLNGAYTIDKTVSGAGNLYPNTNTFNSFSSAIAALTSSCGMAGPVTFNVIAGETFNENPLFIAFTSNSPTATNTLTFVKSGVGADPVILSTANGGDPSDVGDAGILLEGVSYTTFNGIDIKDGGTNNNTYIEYGYALINTNGASVVGCQNDVIKNCTITLTPANNFNTTSNYLNNYNYYATTGIYQAYDNTSLNNIAQNTPTSNAGTNSNNQYYSNTIVGAAMGVMLFAYNSSTYLDQNNTVGVGGGNTILPCAGALTSANMVNALSEGIHINNQYGVHIANNTMTVGGASTSYNGTFGIVISDNTISGGTAEYDHNTITLGGSVGQPSSLSGILFAGGTQTSLLIHDNTVTTLSTNQPTGSDLCGINLQEGSPTTLSVYNNNITNCTASGSQFLGFEFYQASGTSASNVYSNTISNNTCGSNMYQFFTSTGQSPKINFYNNRLYSNTAGSTNYGLYILGSPTITIYNNFIANLKTTGSTTIYGMNINNTGGNAKIYYNSIYLSQATPAATSACILIATTSTGTAPDLRNNLVINNSNPGASLYASALYLASSASSYAGYGATSNNNCYYSGYAGSGSHSVTFYNSAGVNGNLCALQTALSGSCPGAGRDNNSISIDPGFTSATDLHQTNMTTYGPLIAGQPIAGITTDIDGDTRNATTPDIGADEFGCTKPTVPTTPSGAISRCTGSGTNAYTTSSTGAVSYNWTVSGTGNTISGSTTNSATVTWSSTYTGSATVSVTATNVCGTTTAGSVSVTVNAAPTATISGTLSGCAIPGVALGSTGSAAGSGSISGYQWQLGGSNIGGATASTYTATSTGSYNLIVANSNGCSTTSTASAVTANAVPIINTYAASNTFGIPLSAHSWNIDVRADGLGNVFIADAVNNRVLKVNSSGVMSVYVSGLSTSWADDGIFLTTDPTGNLYISSYDDNIIYKVPPASSVGTPSVLASVTGTFGIAYDATTNMLYASIWDGLIDKVNPITGAVTTFVTSALFVYPWGIAVDASGNVYQTNSSGSFSTDNHVYKITPAGVISNFAGSGPTGRTGDGGLATSADLYQPTGVCVDGAGNVYIADQLNNVIREVNASTGIISTYAGINDGGSGNGPDGGLPTSARLNLPYNLSYDPSNGNIYIADYENTRVRVIVPGLPLPSTPSGSASRCQGGGTSVYTSSVAGATSYTWSVTGAGNSVSGTGTTATVTWSSTYSGTAIVSVTGSDACATSPAATLNVTVNTPPVATASASPNPVCSTATLALTGGPASMTTYSWAGPNGYTNNTQSPNIVNPTPAASGVYTLTVTDGNSCSGTASTASLMVNSIPSTIRTFPGSASAGFSQQFGVATDAAGNIYVGDYNDNTVKKITPAGVVSTFAGNGSSNDAGDGGQAAVAHVFGPVGIAVDATGNVYIAEYFFGNIRKVNTLGVISTFCTLPGGAGASAEGLTIDGSGNLYATDFNNSKVYKISSSGTVTPFAGTGGAGYTGDGGSATGATFGFKTSVPQISLEEVAVDASGNVYIADPDNHVIRKVNTLGIISTFAGNGASGNSGDGLAATAATLNEPTGVRVDASGNVYIADLGNNNVRVVNPSGTINTFVNTSGLSGATIDGVVATAAKLNQPYGLGVDASGNLYVSDQGSNSIKEVYASLVPALNGTVTSRCQGAGTSTYTAAAAGATSYNWSLTPAAGSIAGTSTSATVTWNSTYAGTATISVTANNGCGITPASTLNVSVNTPPVATASASPNPVCTSGTLALTGGPAAMTTYAWRGPNSFTNATQSPNITGAPLASAAGVYTLTVTDGNGCTSAATTSSVAINSPLSAPSVPSGPNLRCAGSGTSPYTVSAVAGATSYVWSVSGTGNTISGTTNSSTVTWSPTYSGVGTVSVAGSNTACGTGPSSGLFVSVTPALSGTYTIDNGVSGFLNLFPATRTFNSISSAIAALNNNCGIQAPGVTFNVKPGLTETWNLASTPTIGVIGNGTFTGGTASAPIKFVKNGSGADPVITVTGTTGTDAGIKIEGCNYLTIDGIDITDGGTSQSNWIEVGIAVVRYTATQGCQHDTIRNCKITLNTNDDWSTNNALNNNSDYYATTGILQTTNTSALTSGTDLWSTSSAGAHLFNTYTNNTFTNVGVGIELKGTSGYFQNQNSAPFIPDGNTYIGNNTVTAGTVNSGAEAYGIVSLDQYNLLTITGNTVSSSDNQTDWVYGIFIGDDGIQPGEVEDINHNTVTISSNAGSTQETYGIRVESGTQTTVSIHDNTIHNSTVTGSGVSFALISLGSSVTTSNIYNNTINNNTGSNLTTVTPIEVGGGTTNNVYSNQIFSNASSNGASEINITAGTTNNIHDNLVYSNTNVFSITGINLSGSGTCNVYNNNIHSLQSTSNMGNTVSGISAGTTGGTVATITNIYNNFVADLVNSFGVNALGILLNTSTAPKLYYNSVYLNQASGGTAAFISAGIYLSNTTAAPVDMRNNLVVNNSTPTGSQKAVAIYSAGGSATFDGYASTSNYNDYYAGTPGTQHLIFLKIGGGSNTYQTLSAFSTASGRDANSITNDPGFSPATTTNLHKTNMTYPGYLYLIAGEPITGFTTDIDGDTRNATTPDMGADEFVACEPSRAGTVTGTTSVCQNDNGVVYSVPIVPGATGYNWTLPQGAFIESGTNTNAITVYFQPTASSGNVSVNGTDGCGSGLSSSFAVTVKPIPPLVVTPNNAVCTGTTSATLTASGALTYNWSPATNLTTTNGGITETAQISALTFYTVTGTGANSCTASVIVPVATVPTGGIISPAFSIICSGNTTTLTVTGAAGHDYQWQISTDNINWTNITGATNTSYTTASSDGNSNKFYRMLAQSNSCWNVASTTAEVDVSIPNINVTATNITDNSITLNWSPTGTGNYIVSYSGASSGTQTSVTPPKTITGLTAEGTYSITVTQTGALLASCPASGTITGENTLCAMPTGVTLSSPAPAQIQVSWTGVPGADYRVYYRPLFSYNTYFTKDVSNVSSVLLTKQGANNLYASTTYEVYVSRLDCPNTGNVGQGTNPTNVTTLPTVACATPVIDSVRSLCPVQIEIFMHGSPTNQYNVYLQRITPSILAVNSYGVTGNYFTINTPYSGDQYLIAVDSRCAGGALSSLYIYPGNVTVKPLCNAPTNLVLSNPICHGFTASWNADQCLSNSASQYAIYVRVTGTINYNEYGVALPGNGIGPNKLMNFLTSGRTYQVFVRSIYNCNGFVTYGPTSQVETITTLSSGCRDEDTEQPTENKPAVQQYSPDNSEVFSLYPNPNSGKFVVDLSRVNMAEDAVRIEVINMLGQTVMTQLTTISGGQMSEYVNLPNGTAAGTYIVRLTAGKNVYTSKVNVSK